MYKQLRWIVITFFLIPLLLIVSAIPSFAEGKNNEEEGKVIFRYRTDFEDLYRFLGVNEAEYNQIRKQKSIVEIAEEKGISEDEVFNYFARKKFDALEKSYEKGDFDIRFVMDYCLRLKDDIEWEINAKKSKDGSLTTE
ncbi:hypothetical protein Q8G35_18920 [Peribacillus simplex]|uniref:DUF2680 domain-containing protein n=2 Tax=Peribacillus TaxID=2675229 RepID=A0AA90P7T5_9BACI|nr:MULTISPECIES: hypothetical protein [Peribacillus]MDP1420397.1 hypothetical protein [Peribacillus simplex]MDP1454808.1 hypothetical protein [Peribacillus frigoritolerans]